MSRLLPFLARVLLLPAADASARDEHLRVIERYCRNVRFERVEGLVGPQVPMPPTRVRRALAGLADSRAHRLALCIYVCRVYRAQRLPVGKALHVSLRGPEGLLFREFGRLLGYPLDGEASSLPTRMVSWVEQRRPLLPRSRELDLLLQATE